MSRLSYGVVVVAVQTDEGSTTGGGGVVPRPLSSFVGREPLLVALRELLGPNPLVTLTGVGGTGKTRLALELARQLRPAYEDGVRLVSLAGASGSDPEMLAQLVSAAVGVPDQVTTAPVDTLVEYLEPRRMLLILDNCEHLVKPVARLVSTVLGQAPHVRIVATSRERLRVPGEKLVVVPPLKVPPEDTPQDRATDYEAVNLLINRAEESVPGWQITPATWPHVVRLLNRVAGIPLGVELAVVRLRSMPVEVLADKLDDLMRVLTLNDTTALPHHRTMGALIQWSYDLCTPAERLLWARLSMAEGSFSWAAAHALGVDEHLPAEQIPDVLAGLLDKSVLLPAAAPATGDRSRYFMLEPLKQFGAAQLREVDGVAEVQARHREHYRREATRLAEGFQGHNEVELVASLKADLPNFRVVLAELLEDPERARDALQMAVDMARTRGFFYSGELPEQRLWLGRALEKVPAGPDLLRASALALDAWVAVCLGADHDQVVRLIAEATEAARVDGSDSFPAVDFVAGAFRTMSLGEIDGLELLRRARDGFAALGPAAASDRQMAEIMVALAGTLLGDRATASAAADELDRSCRENGAQWALAWAVLCRTVVEARWGDAERAVETVLDSLRFQRSIHDRWTPMWSIMVLAYALARAVCPDDEHRVQVWSTAPRAWRELPPAGQVARMLGLSDALHHAAGIEVANLPAFYWLRESAEEAARCHLGEPEFERFSVADVGGVDEALAVVLDNDPAPRQRRAVTAATLAALTPAERNVAELMADGLKNQDIAEKLVISRRTVETHVRRIYRKLGNPTRVELARLVNG